MASETLEIVIGGDATGATSAADQANSAMGGLSGTLKKMAIAGGVLFLAKKGFDLLSDAITKTLGFISGSINIAAEFEASMRNVNSIMGLSEQEFRDTSEAVTEMATKFPQSAKQLAEGLYDIASSGFSGSEALLVLEASAKAASAGLTDTQTSSLGITAVLNAYGLEAKDAGRVSDIMFTTVKKGVTTFQALSTNLGKVLSTAKASNISFEEMSGALAYMTTKGIQTEEATTALNQVMLSFIKPTEAMTQALQNAGYESGEMALEEIGLAGALELLSEATGGSITKLTDMLGNIQAVKGGAALLGGGFEELQAFMGGFTGESEAASEAFDEQSKAYAFQLDILKTNFEDVKKTIGDAFLPVLENVITKISESGGIFDTFSGGISNIADGVSKFLDLHWSDIEVAAGKVLIVVENIMDGLSGMIGYFSEEKVMIDPIKGITKLSFADKLLDYWDIKIMPVLIKKVGEIWEGMGIWVTENEEVIKGWGVTIGEVVGEMLKSTLMLIAGAQEVEDASIAVKFGIFLGESIIEGIKEAFKDINIAALLFDIAKGAAWRGAITSSFGLLGPFAPLAIEKLTGVEGPSSFEELIGLNIDPQGTAFKEVMVETQDAYDELVLGIKESYTEIEERTKGTVGNLIEYFTNFFDKSEEQYASSEISYTGLMAAMGISTRETFTEIEIDGSTALNVIGLKAIGAQAEIDKMHGVDLTSTHTITTYHKIHQQISIGYMAGPKGINDGSEKQSGGSTQAGYISDLDYFALGGEWVLPPYVVRAIRENRSSGMGINMNANNARSNLVVNITGNTFIDKEDMLDTIEREIPRRLNLQGANLG